MAATKGAAGGKLFGLPRNVAIGAALLGVALVAYFFWKSRSANGTAAQAALPADASAAGTDLAAPALGGTPDSGASDVTLTGSDLLSAFEASQTNLTSGFQSQQQLIETLTGGIQSLATSSEEQVASIAASAISSAGTTTTTTINNYGPPLQIDPVSLPQPVTPVGPAPGPAPVTVQAEPRQAPRRTGPLSAS